MRRLVVFVRNAAPYNKAGVVSMSGQVSGWIPPAVMVYDVEQGDG